MSNSTEKNQKAVSRFLALILRHQPESIGLQVDKHGWGSIDYILANAPRDLPPLSRSLIEQVVTENDKGRFAISPDGNHIRALQGHSIQVDLELNAVEPPATLFHGTVEGFVDSIRSSGLKPASRQHVHLSADMETAMRVAKRRKGRVVIFSVDCLSMRQEGHAFFLSENKVWLTDTVPSRYLTEVSPDLHPSSFEPT